MWTLFLHLPDRYLIGMGLWLGVLLFAPRWLLKLRWRFREQPQRRRAVHAALSAWFVVGILTAIELGFALLYDTTDSFDMTNVSHRWFEVHVAPDLKQLAFKDGSGIDYRDEREFPTSVGADRKHLCFLGDSFTFGHGVPHVGDRFSNQLRSRLAGQPQTAGKYVISNLSKPGSDLLWGEAVLARLYADRHQINAAVYVLCLNDIEMFHDRRMDFNNELAALRNRPSFFLWRDSYFFNWGYYRVSLLSQSNARNYYDFVRDFYAGPAWTRFEETLVRVDRMAAEHDSNFVVVIFPFLHNLGDQYPFADIHHQIATACDQQRIGCVDLLPRLQAAARDGKRLTVNPFDAHPNELAHRIVADELLRQFGQIDSAKK